FSTFKEETPIKVLFIGDIVGSPGRQAVKETLPILKKQYQPDIIVANGENAAAGRGLTLKTAAELYQAGIQCITMGNHTWDQKEIFDFIDNDEKLIRPANFPVGTPGKGEVTIKSGEKELTVINLQGRTFLPPLDCPFRYMDDWFARNNQSK